MASIANFKLLALPTLHHLLACNSVLQSSCLYRQLLPLSLVFEATNMWVSNMWVINMWVINMWVSVHFNLLPFLIPRAILYPLRSQASVQNHTRSKSFISSTLLYANK